MIHIYKWWSVSSVYNCPLKRRFIMFSLKRTLWGWFFEIFSDYITKSTVFQPLNFHIRVTECSIANAAGDRVVYPIHSFDPAGRCFDKRFAVQQLSTLPNVEIAFRSFRFTSNGNGGQSDSQNQKVTCKIHLDPPSVSPTTIDCSCFSPTECATATNPCKQLLLSNMSTELCHKSSRAWH